MVNLSVVLNTKMLSILVLLTAECLSISATSTVRLMVPFSQAKVEQLYNVDINRTHSATYREKPLSSCDRIFVEENFFLRSPNYPGGYHTFTECHYLVKRANRDICGLELKFLKFDIEPSDGCVYDFLEVDRQKLCGIIASEAVRVFMFNEDRMNIKFISDAQITRSGFNIHVRQTKDCYPGNVYYPPPSCNVYTDSETGELHSLGHPKKYRSNLICMYKIKQRDRTFCTVTLRFLDFDLDYTAGCFGDYLEVDGQRFCGTTLQGRSRTISFGIRDTVALIFRTDAVSVKRGFRLGFQQNHCSGMLTPLGSLPKFPSRDDPSVALDYSQPIKRVSSEPLKKFEVFGSSFPSRASKSAFLREEAQTFVEEKAPGYCVHVFSERDFVIQSKNFPSNYEDNLDCQYVIRRRSNICGLQLIFISFEVESSQNCEYDYLEVDEERFCGSLPADLVRNLHFETNEKILRFHSDGANPRPGFLIQVHQKECASRTDTPISGHHCHREFSDQVFDLTSPNYPENYGNTLDCSYTINRFSNNICFLELQFLDFSLQDEVNCQYDYLQIYKNSFCGNIDRGFIRSFEFQDHSTIIRFHTDAISTSRGFHIRVTQKECNFQASPPPDLSPVYCNKRFSSKEFEIRSVNYPINYDNNLDCRYTILRFSDFVCKLEFTFKEFQIPNSPSCSDDYLEVEQERLCGKLTSNVRRIIEFNETAKVLSFHSDDRHTDRGYVIRVVQEECNLYTTGMPFVSDRSFCSNVYTRKEFYLKSANYPSNYDNNLDCIYTVRRHSANICTLKLQFLHFDIESSTNCEYDYVDVDGQKLCGTLPPETSKNYDFQSFEKVIRFRTDSASSRPGFQIKVTQEECLEDSFPTSATPSSSPCHRRYTETEFDIRSEEYPREYPNNLDCRYIVHRQRDSCKLELTFLSFDVEVNENCQYDYVSVNGETLCGLLPVGEKRTLDFKTSEIVIEFHSDSATSRPGFHIRAKQIPCSSKLFPPEDSESCDETYDALNGVIQSKGYPGNYHDNLVCTYRFKPQPGYCNVVLSFSDFQLEPSRGRCVQDYLEINGVRYCGKQLKGDTRTLRINAEQREAFVQFVTDQRFTDRGFKASFRQVLCSTDQPFTTRPPITPLVTLDPGNSCERLYTSSSFELTSPNYSNHYGNNLDCLYTILRINNQICKLRMTFESFDVETSNGCQYDYLKIEDEPLCGILPRNSVREYDFQNFEFVIRFHSDPANTRPGFKIHVQQVDCHRSSPEQSDPHLSTSQTHIQPLPTIAPTLPQPITPPISTINCNKVVTRPFFELYSVNYPDLYPNGLNCRYSIKRFNESVCRLELVLVRFDLEPSTNCQFDYLSVDNEKLCGHLPRNTTRNYKLSSSEKHIYFRSDERVRGQGFIIKGRQVVCPGHSAGPSSRPPFELPGLRERCDEEFYSEDFVLRSPNYPQNYPNDVTCRYLIHQYKPEVCALDVTVHSFDLEESRNCEYDYLDINDQRLCGQIPSNSFKIIPFQEKNFVQLLFHSDKATNRPGFSVRVQQVTQCQTHRLRPTWRPATPPPALCTYCQRQERGHFTSPGFPEPYKNGVRCSYRIQPVKGFCGVEIFFHEFEVEFSTGCQKDFFKLENRRFCGTQLRKQTREVDFRDGPLPEVQLKFESDDFSSDRGFHLEYRQIPCRNIFGPLRALKLSDGGLHTLSDTNRYSNTSSVDYIKRSSTPGRFTEWEDIHTHVRNGSLPSQAFFLDPTIDLLRLDSV
ncbi:cubilin-like [Limulus polyphemus]|uniref:Cubilin-like n=1 Tax=Limulus polyphemus TaxID=6850 RepID=A0ABM1BTA6_LIMPO|nr:cubilin-like [Limulus polyphemus]